MFSSRKATSQDQQLLMKMDCECFVYGWDEDAWKHAIKTFEVYIGTWNYKPIGYWVGCKSEEDGNEFRAIRLGVNMVNREKKYSVDLWESLEQNAANFGYKAIMAVIPENLCRPGEFGYCAEWLNKVAGMRATGKITKQFFTSHGTQYDGFTFRKQICPEKPHDPSLNSGNDTYFEGL